MPTAVIAFDFDPLLRLAEDLVVRWQTVALASVIALTLIIAGVFARRDGLRSDDLLFIAVGTVPGAVIGGRIGYVLLHLPYYQANPGAIIDPGLGAMELALGVAGGLLTGSAVASLLGAPIGAWRHLVVLPLLMVLGVGKLTMILGGAGQGAPSGAAWATAFLGPGPWGSLAPALPSTPSQAYEAIATLLIVVGLIAALALGAFGRRDGRVLFVGVALWAFARAVVATSWRDEPVLAGLNMGSVIAIAVGLGCLAVVATMTVRARRRPTGSSERAGDPPGGPAAPVDGPVTSWPDPNARPRF